MSTPTPADLLDRAAEILDAKGFVKGMERDETGAVCGWGALLDARTEHEQKVGQNHPEFVAVYYAYDDAQREFKLVTGANIPLVNDQRWTTKGRMKRLLRKTAKHWRTYHEASSS